MKAIKQVLRLFKINYVLARNGLDQLVFSIKPLAPISFLVYLNPWNWFRKRKLTRGQALRLTLEELGPIFIKFGQALSTRPDVIPADIAIELSQLQDNVPPFAASKVLDIIEKTFGQSAYDIFAKFDSEALASASIAQVHPATLHTGEEVVVKVLRPDMRKVLESDLAILHTLANLIERYWSGSKRLKPKEIVAEFHYNLMNELDLMREAANAAQLKRNFDNSHLLYIPAIYWDYCRDNVLVMERIHGIPISNINALHESEINIQKLAERGVEIFFTQVFRDCFFHADMHAGNIFVSSSHPNNPQYICVDFGIVGTLDDDDKHYLAQNLLAFFNRDYRRVAELHVESGWVAKETRVTEFESAIRTVCEPIFERPLKDISFARVVISLFQTARRFKMEVQPQLILLQKTLLAIEGLGRQLYPNLDLWKTAKPFLEKWVREQVGPQAFIKQCAKNLPFISTELPHLPRVLSDVLQLAKERRMAEIQKEKEQNYLATHQKSTLHNVSTGAFIAFSSLTVLSYFLSTADKQLTEIAVAGTIISGLLQIYPKKRS